MVFEDAARNVLKGIGCALAAPFLAVWDVFTQSFDLRERSQKVFRGIDTLLSAILFVALVLLAHTSAGIFAYTSGAVTAFLFLPLFYVGSILIRLASEALCQIWMQAHSNGQYTYNSEAVWQRGLFGYNELGLKKINPDGETPVTCIQDKLGNAPSISVPDFKQNFLVPLMLLFAVAITGFGLFAVSYLSVTGGFVFHGLLLNEAVRFLLLAFGLAATTQIIVRFVDSSPKTATGRLFKLGLEIEELMRDVYPEDENEKAATHRKGELAEKIQSFYDLVNNSEEAELQKLFGSVERNANSGLPNSVNTPSSRQGANEGRLLLDERASISVGVEDRGRDGSVAGGIVIRDSFDWNKWQKELEEWEQSLQSEREAPGVAEDVADNDDGFELPGDDALLPLPAANPQAQQADRSSHAVAEVKPAESGLLVSNHNPVGKKPTTISSLRLDVEAERTAFLGILSKITGTTEVPLLEGPVVPKVDPDAPQATISSFWKKFLGAVAIISLMIATMIVFAIFSGAIDIANAGVSVSFAVLFGLASLISTKALLNRTSAGPYGELTTIFAGFTTVCATLTLLGGLELAGVAGKFVGANPFVITTAAFNGMWIGLLVFGALTAAAAFLSHRYTSQGNRDLHREPADSRKNWIIPANRYQWARFFLNLVKFTLMVSCFLVALLTIGMLFNLDFKSGIGGVLGINNLMDFATDKIIIMLGIGGLEMGTQWLIIFSVTTFGLAVFAGVYLLQSLIEKRPSSAADLKQGKTANRVKTALGQLAKLGAIAGAIFILKWATIIIPGASLDLFTPCIIVAVVMPLFSGNSFFHYLAGEGKGRAHGINQWLDKVFGVTRLGNSINLGGRSFEIGSFPLTVIRELWIAFLLFGIPTIVLASVGIPLNISPTHIILLGGAGVAMIIRLPTFVMNLMQDGVEPGLRPTPGSESEDDGVVIDLQTPPPEREHDEPEPLSVQAGLALLSPGQVQPPAQGSNVDNSQLVSIPEPVLAQTVTPGNAFSTSSAGTVQDTTDTILPGGNAGGVNMSLVIGVAGSVPDGQKPEKVSSPNVLQENANTVGPAIRGSIAHPIEVVSLAEEKHENPAPPASLIIGQQGADAPTGMTIALPAEVPPPLEMHEAPPLGPAKGPTLAENKIPTGTTIIVPDEKDPEVQDQLSVMRGAIVSKLGWLIKDLEEDIRLTETPFQYQEANQFLSNMEDVSSGFFIKQGDISRETGISRLAWVASKDIYTRLFENDKAKYNQAAADAEITRLTFANFMEILKQHANDPLIAHISMGGDHGAHERFAELDAYRRRIDIPKSTTRGGGAPRWVPLADKSREGTYDALPEAGPRDRGRGSVGSIIGPRDGKRSNNGSRRPSVNPDNSLSVTPPPAPVDVAAITAMFGGRAERVPSRTQSGSRVVTPGDAKHQPLVASRSGDHLALPSAGSGPRRLSLSVPATDVANGEGQPALPIPQPIMEVEEEPQPEQKQLQQPIASVVHTHTGLGSSALNLGASDGKHAGAFAAAAAATPVAPTVEASPAGDSSINKGSQQPPTSS